MNKLLKYPTSAMCFCLAFHPFSIFGGTWFDFANRNKTMTERAKADANAIWWLRLGPFTLSYRRML